MTMKNTNFQEEWLVHCCDEGPDKNQQEEKGVVLKVPSMMTRKVLGQEYLRGYTVGHTVSLALNQR